MILIIRFDRFART